MKNIILLIGAVAFSIALIAQENSLVYANSELIRLLPREGNGYLAWHDDNPDVKYWVVEIDEYKFDNFVFVGEKRVWRKEVWKSNYVKIPDEYWNGAMPGYDYYTNLIGFDADDKELIRTRFGADMAMGNPFQKEGYPPVHTEEGCRWICNGPNWAWLIQQYKTSNASSFYRLEDATVYDSDGNLIVSYNEYMTVEYFNEMAALTYYERQFWADWYGISNDDFGLNAPPYFPNSPFRKIPNDGGYTDKNGYPISSNEYSEVVKVHKKMGWWENKLWDDGSAVYFSTGAISNPASQCVNDRQWMINFFINNSDITDYIDPADVSCDGNQVLCCWEGPVSSGGDSGGESCSVSWLWMDWNDDNIVNGLDFFYYFEEECDSGPDGPDGSSSVSLMTIENISNPSIPYTALITSEFFDENGVFTAPEFTIEKGLNKLLVILKDGTEKYIVYDATETTESDYQLSDFLDVVIYPVPIQGDDFKMNIQCGATLDFSYELFDFQGYLLHSTKYSVKQGHNEDHKVRSDKPVPRGLLLNKFTFSDGSSLSVTTTKE